MPGLHDAVGLRNVLIHGYAEIVDDVPRLAQTLADLMTEVDEHR